eukprot:ANDGO_06102.mRNA.1 hypothetical protein
MLRPYTKPFGTFGPVDTGQHRTRQFSVSDSAATRAALKSEWIRKGTGSSFLREVPDTQRIQKFLDDSHKRLHKQCQETVTTWCPEPYVPLQSPPAAGGRIKRLSEVPLPPTNKDLPQLSDVEFCRVIQSLLESGRPKELIECMKEIDAFALRGALGVDPTHFEQDMKIVGRVQCALARFGDLMHLKKMDLDHWIVVCGFESSGKTTLLSALLGFPAGVTCANTATRCPIMFYLSVDEKCQETMFRIHHWEGNFQDPNCAMSREGTWTPIAKLLDELQRHTENVRKECTPKDEGLTVRSLKVEIKSHYLPFTGVVVDTPGLKIAGGGNGKNAANTEMFLNAFNDQITSIIQTYIQDRVARDKNSVTIISVTNGSQPNAENFYTGRLRKLVPNIDDRVVEVFTRLDTGLSLRPLAAPNNQNGSAFATLQEQEFVLFDVNDAQEFDRILLNMFGAAMTTIRDAARFTPHCVYERKAPVCLRGVEKLCKDFSHMSHKQFCDKMDKVVCHHCTELASMTKGLLHRDMLPNFAEIMRLFSAGEQKFDVDEFFSFARLPWMLLRDMVHSTVATIQRAFPNGVKEYVLQLIDERGMKIGAQVAQNENRSLHTRFQNLSTALVEIVRAALCSSSQIVNEVPTILVLDLLSGCPVFNDVWKVFPLQMHVDNDLRCSSQPDTRTLEHCLSVANLQLTLPEGDKGAFFNVDHPEDHVLRYANSWQLMMWIVDRCLEYFARCTLEIAHGRERVFAGNLGLIPMQTHGFMVAAAVRGAASKSMSVVYDVLLVYMRVALIQVVNELCNISTFLGRITVKSAEMSDASFLSVLWWRLRMSLIHAIDDIFRDLHKYVRSWTFDDVREEQARRRKQGEVAEALRQYADVALQAGGLGGVPDAPPACPPTSCVGGADTGMSAMHSGPLQGNAVWDVILRCITGLTNACNEELWTKQLAEMFKITLRQAQLQIHEHFGHTIRSRLHDVFLADPFQNLGGDRCQRSVAHLNYMYAKFDIVRHRYVDPFAASHKPLSANSEENQEVFQFGPYGDDLEEFLRSVIPSSLDGLILDECADQLAEATVMFAG